jgi:hypothetical protein
VIEREYVYEVGVKIIHLEGEDLYRFRRYITNLSKRPPAQNRAKERAAKVKKQAMKKS